MITIATIYLILTECTHLNIWKQLEHALGGCSWFCIVLLSADQLLVLIHGFPALPRTSAAKFCDASRIQEARGGCL